ncbi:MAG TPA: 4Fe-4S binding protein [Candidatus Pullichristensenella excrementigallinarum]|uniref:4Fe-4S binding protein n=1 Tax=Candidatus Pullichristensenella excrementigallinarum TaxID=2840907 RepID=A0A9D1IFG9_9FIRM|nr:4Fe-4S binding protein [Candidatus Pullichristensenella excrementigallinarum]
MISKDYLKLNEAKCKDCYACIRHCPVKAISFSNGQANIIADECVLCGQCYVVCPQNAKRIRNDVDVVREAMRQGKRVIASVAPSFLVAFDVDTIEDMSLTLKKLGFADAEETAIGAELVSKAYEKYMEKDTGAMISSCCPAVNSLIEKYYPDLIGHLLPVKSPMRAHCDTIKARDKDAFTVFIGPCIAKKRETDESKSVDACLTFEELSMWMGEAGVTPVRKAGDVADHKKSRYYPTTGGILKTLNPDIACERITVDGMENCRRVLDELRDDGSAHVFIEMSACEGSCINGPVMREHHKKRMMGAVKIERYAGEGAFGKEVGAPIETTYQAGGLKRVMPGNDAIQQVLNRMGKTTPDKEFNCGCCGYPTCRDKAIAVCQGKAEIEMCLPYLKEKAESFSDKIIQNTPNAILVMDEDLIVKQINQSAVRLFNLSSASDIVGAPVVRLLDPSDYLKVVTTGRGISSKRHYIAEYKLFVDETVLYDRQYKILISIMRDVTEQEMRRAQEKDLHKHTVEVTDQVIDKQMRVVQEIASLLGETTAETKIALTKLKEAISHDE